MEPEATFGATASTGAGHRASAFGWLLVAVQLVLVAMLVGELRRVWHARPLRRLVGGLLALGGVAVMGVAAAQLGRSLHPHPMPTAAAGLRTDGLYRQMRHPLYSGLLAWAGGVAIIGGGWRAWAAFAALMGVLTVKAPYEERQLALRFPEYEAYARRTPRFLPRLSRLPLHRR